MFDYLRKTIFLKLSNFCKLVILNYVMYNIFIELPLNLYKKFTSKAIMSVYCLSDMEFIPYR